MPTTIQDTLLDGLGNAIQNSPVSVSPSSTPVFQNFSGTYRELSAPWPSPLTSSSGQFTLSLPRPSETDPSTEQWSISLPNGLTWVGIPPDDTLTHTIYDLKTNHGWQVGVVRAIPGVVVSTTGPQGPAGAAWTWQGTWVNVTNYSPRDVVYYNGSSYISLISSNVGIIPGSDNTKWQTVAIGGASAVSASYSTPGVARQNLVNVRDYGAVGDGVTDDTAAIASAIAAAAASTSELFMPAGTYMATPGTSLSTINGNAMGTVCWSLPSNVRIRGTGAGTIIKLKNAAGPYHSMFFGRGVTGVAIRDLTIDQNVLNNTLQPMGSGYSAFQRAISFVDGCSHCWGINIVVNKCNGIQTLMYDVITPGLVNYDCWWDGCYTFFQMTSPCDFDNTAIYNHGDGGITRCTANTTTSGYKGHTAAVAIANATWSGGTATITTSAAHFLITGQQAVVSGVNVSTGGSYNGTFTVTRIDATNFSYTLAAGGTFTSSPNAIAGSPPSGGRTGFELQGLSTQFIGNKSYGYMFLADVTGGQAYGDSFAGSTGNGQSVISGNMGKGLSVGLTVWQTTGCGPVVISDNILEFNQGVSISDPLLGTVTGQNYYQSFGIQIVQGLFNGGANDIVISGNVMKFADEGAGRSVDAIGNLLSSGNNYGIGLLNYSPTTNVNVFGNIIENAPGVGIGIGYPSSVNYVLPEAFATAPANAGAGGNFAASSTWFGYSLFSTNGESTRGGDAVLIPTVSNKVSMGIHLDNSYITKVGIYCSLGSTVPNPFYRVGTVAVSYNGTNWTVGAITYDSPNVGLIASATVGGTGLTTVLTVTLNNVSGVTVTAPGWNQSIPGVFNVRINNNLIVNPGQNSQLPSSTRVGIYGVGSLVNVHIADNQMGETWATSRVGYGIYMTTGGSSYQNVFVRNPALEKSDGTLAPNQIDSKIETGYSWLTQTGGSMVQVTSVGASTLSVNAQTGQRAAVFNGASGQIGISVNGVGTGIAAAINSGVGGTAMQIAGGGTSTGGNLLTLRPGQNDFAVTIVTSGTSPGTNFRVMDSSNSTVLASIDALGNLLANTIKPVGLTGATLSSRYAGAVSGAAPATGTFALGDYVVDQTGTIRICTTAGSPGTWSQITSIPGGAASGDLGGSYPSPTVLHLTHVTDASLPASGIAAVNPSSLTGTGTVPLAGLSGITTTQLSATAGIVAGQIASVNPSTLTGTGTVPLAGLSGITTTQLSATAGIVGSQLSATAGIVAGQITSVNPSALTGTGTVPLAGLTGLTTTQLSATAGILGSQLSATAGLVAGQITSVNPSALTGTGTVPLAGLSGITTTQLDAAAGITSGQIASVAAATITGSHTLPDGTLSTNVPLLNAANAFTAQNTFSDSTLGTEPLVLTPHAQTAHIKFSPGSASSSTGPSIDAGTAYSKGDLLVDANAVVWICTTAGTGTASVWSALQGGGSRAASSNLSAEPMSHGYQAWTDDVITPGTTLTLATGNLYLTKIWVPQTITVTSFVFYLGTAGTTSDGTANSCVVGLYSSSGTPLWTSADLSGATIFGGSADIKIATISAGNPTSLTITGGAGVFVWAAFSFKWSAGTAPGLLARSMSTSHLVNALAGVVTYSQGRSVIQTPNISQASGFTGVTGSGATLALPNITPAANAAGTHSIWAGLI